MPNYYYYIIIEHKSDVKISMKGLLQLFSDDCILCCYLGNFVESLNTW